MAKFQFAPDNRNLSDEDLLADVRRVASMVGSRPLTRNLYRENGGRVYPDTVAKRFGGWLRALKQAGVPQAVARDVTRAELIEEMRRVAKELKQTHLTFEGFCRHARYSPRHVRRHFSSWAKALEAARLQKSPSSHAAVSDEELFADIERLWKQLGRQPRCSDIGWPQTSHHLNTYKNRFGGWRRALEAFVESASDHTHTANQNDGGSSPAAIQISGGRRRTSRAPSWRLRFMVMRRDGFRCRQCGQSPATTPGTILVLDHIQPWSRGGETELENLQTLCEQCNAGKGSLE